MTELDFETWDVFTKQRFAGNPLAVVFDADGLDADAMQAITREFDYSESVFVLAPDAPGVDARIRIFTPGGELPFAGHPTVGAACAIARRRGLRESMTLDLAAGRFPVRLGDGSVAWAEFANPNLPRVQSEGPDAALVERALGLADGSLDRTDQRPRRAGAGIDFIYARAALDSVRSARLDAAAWEAIPIADTCGVLLYAPAGDDRWHVRMFAPHIGVPEDPATGSAAAGLPAQLLAAGLLGDGRHRLEVTQGVEMGRPSRIEVTVEVDHGAFRSLIVGGAAVPVMRGRIAC